MNTRKHFELNDKKYISELQDAIKSVIKGSFRVKCTQFQDSIPPTPALLHGLRPYLK